jgi:hypothetical protein
MKSARASTSLIFLRLGNGATSPVGIIMAAAITGIEYCSEVYAGD